MTGLPARRLGWTNRGHIAPGQWADLVVLDRQRIRDRATFQDPHRYAEGVRHVLVRGEFVLRAGQMTGRRPGRPVVSVPAANTPSTRIRRDLLDLLQRHDGRYGLYARRADGTEEIAINADDPFTFEAPDGTFPRALKATLRDWTQRLARTNTESHRARPPDAQNASRYRLFTKLTVGEGGESHVCVAYDGVQPGTLSSIAKLVEGPLVARLRRYFNSSARPKP